MLIDIVVPLIMVGLAELGDKTQLSILVMASRTKEHFQLLLGIVFAFLIVDGLAISFGSWITDIIPFGVLKMAAGGAFIILGFLQFRDRERTAKMESYGRSSFLSGFGMIFLTEWGDKTQIAALLLSTQYNPVIVLTGTMSALILLSAMAIYLGKTIANKIDRELMARIAGVVFILIGLMSFIL